MKVNQGVLDNLSLSYLGLLGWISLSLQDASFANDAEDERMITACDDRTARNNGGFDVW